MLLMLQKDSIRQSCARLSQTHVVQYAIGCASLFLGDMSRSSSVGGPCVGFLAR